MNEAETIGAIIKHKIEEAMGEVVSSQIKLTMIQISPYFQWLLRVVVFEVFGRYCYRFRLPRLFFLCLFVYLIIIVLNIESI